MDEAKRMNEANQLFSEIELKVVPCLTLRSKMQAPAKQIAILRAGSLLMPLLYLLSFHM